MERPAETPMAELPPTAQDGRTDLTEQAAKRLSLIGRSTLHRIMLHRLAKAASTDAEVMICGPTGVGKELCARFLHECSSRRAAGFIPLNCGALPDGLLENELFGHVGGAFTGARSSAEGLVAQAEGGTLFLDEVDSLSLNAQVKLLRLLQEREYRRLGEARVRRANVRFVAASNADLLQHIHEKRFREDLFYRLHVVRIDVPQLKDRIGDVALLAAAFISRWSETYGLPRVELTDAALAHLGAYHWPGNVRELENCIRALICLQPGRPLEPEDLNLLSREPLPPSSAVPAEFPDTTFQQAKGELVRRFEVQYLRYVLSRAGGNISEAARLAGKDRRAFFELMRKHRLQSPAVRSERPDECESI